MGSDALKSKGAKMMISVAPCSPKWSLRIRNICVVRLELLIQNMSYHTYTIRH